MLCKLRGAGHCTSAKRMTSILRHVAALFPPARQGKKLPSSHSYQDVNGAKLSLGDLHNDDSRCRMQFNVMTSGRPLQMNIIEQKSISTCYTNLARMKMYEIDYVLSVYKWIIVNVTIFWIQDQSNYITPIRTNCTVYSTNCTNCTHCVQCLSYKSAHRRWNHNWYKSLIMWSKEQLVVQKRRYLDINKSGLMLRNSSRIYFRWVFCEEDIKSNNLIRVIPTDGFDPG